MATETAKAKGEVKELTQLTQSERRQAEEARRESHSDRLETKQLRKELQASDRRTPLREPLEGREQVLTDEAALAKAYAEHVRTQTKEFVTWNDQITEGLRKDLAESQEEEMACCDEDRSQLYDKVVEQAGEIHDLDFHLATAKAYASARIACANHPDCGRRDQTMGKSRTWSERVWNRSTLNRGRGQFWSHSPLG